MRNVPYGRALCAIGIDVTALVSLRPSTAKLCAAAADPADWARTVGIDHAAADVARLGLWLVAAWVAVVLSLGFAAALPGAVGRFASHGAQLAAPAALRRLLAGVTGLAILLAPAEALAASSDSTGPTPFPNRSTSVALLVPTSSQATTVGDRSATSDPGVRPGPAWPNSRVEAAPHTEEVTVRPGDSLWLIARRHLDGPAGQGPSASVIAQQCRRWYEANRTTVGEDPNLILPGMVLRTPTSAPSPTAADDPIPPDDHARPMIPKGAP